MEKIKREDWISVKDRLPEHDLICLITDGRDVTVAVADTGWKPIDWNVCGVEGYEWENSFEPTHWMALSVELPDVGA